MFFLLKFNSHQKGGKYLIFSLPESNQYQQIKDFKILFPKKYHIIKENRWGNKVIVFRLNDVLQKYPQISFNFQPKELKLKINKSFALNHYSLKQKLINNSFINGEDKKIKTLAKKIIGSEKNLYQIIKRLYNFTLDYLTYGKQLKDYIPTNKL
jgi:hypothetical protein